jgi:hypothetical protein
MTLKERDSKRYSPGEGREMAICYATSKDGIVWEKPALGLAPLLCTKVSAKGTRLPQSEV